MAPYLLWIESVLAAMCFTALFMTWMPRRTLVRVALRMAAWVGPGVPALGFVVVVSQLSVHDMLSPFWVGYGVMWLVGWCVGAVVMWRMQGLSVPGFAVATVLLGSLTGITFWTVDARIQGAMATVRAEAMALAMSSAPLRVADRDNAAVLYAAAIEAMPDESPEMPADWFDTRKPLAELATNAALDECLAAHATGLALVRQAAAMPHCYFDRDYSRPTEMIEIPSGSAFGRFGRLLHVHARRELAQGRVQAALADCVALVGAAGHLNQDAILISTLVATMIQNRANEVLAEALSVWKTNPNAAELPADVPLVAFGRIMPRMWRLEEAWGLLLFAQATDDGFGVDQVKSDANNSWIQLHFPQSIWRVLWLHEDLASYRRLFKQYQRLAFEVRTKELPEVDLTGAGPITKMLVPAFNSIFTGMAKGDAQHRIMRVALAMARHLKRTGAPPSTLAELVPAELPAVPVDPFTRQPLKLARQGNAWVVYSVGADREDNGGNPDTDITLTLNW